MATTHQVAIQGMAYNPNSVSIAAGDTVEWKNETKMTHTATGNSGEFDSGDIAPNGTFSHTFDTAGTIEYHCEIHPRMKGTVEVGAAESGGEQYSDVNEEGAATTHQVTIQAMAFNPKTVSIAAGDTVEWTNKMGIEHTATGDSGEFDSGPISPNATFSNTFGDAGTITYHCDIHPFMTGTVEVSGS